MPRITRSCIDEIKTRVNIYDVVSPIVKLRKSGRNFVGLSPFTNEKTPSFFVLPEKNIFKCFSSGYAGDCFRFLELYEKLTFTEAIEALANRFGINLHYESGAPPAGQNRSLRKALLEIHQHAERQFHERFLARHPDSAKVRAYWEGERQFTLAIAKEFKIGFAPPDDRELLSLLRRKGFPIEALKKCGLFYFPDRATNLDSFRPRFRGRLMIPIRDYRGQVIAFTARQLDLTPSNDSSRHAKYINSPETPIFHKSRVVFGLDRAREHIDTDGTFLLVEGQLDALRCWQHQINTAVAPQGTSITEEQLLLLRRYTNRIDCLFDGDAAGRKAVLRLLPMAFATGIDIRVITLEEGSDPDSLLLNGGRRAFENLRQTAHTAIEFAVQSLLPSQTLSPQKKADVFVELSEMILNCQHQITQDGYLSEMARLLHLNDDSARRDFRQIRHRRMRRRITANPETANAHKKNGLGRLTTADYELLLLVFHYQGLNKSIAEVVDFEWVDTQNLHGRLLCKVLAAIREGLWDGPQNLAHTLEIEEERDATFLLLAEEPEFEDPVSVANDCIRSLFERYLREKSRVIEEQISLLPAPSDDFPILQRELIALRSLKREAPQLTQFSAQR